MIERRLQTNDNGFTIIEMLFASMGFSVIMLLLILSLLHVDHLYYKGRISGKTDDAVRNIMIETAQAVQFSGGDVFKTLPTALAPTGTAQSYCIGQKRFTFVPSMEYVAAGQHRFVADQTEGGCVDGVTAARDMTPATPLANDDEELLGQHMRIVKFTITQYLGDLYQIDARVAYGSDDMLCSPMVAGCGSSPSDLLHDNLVCKSDSLNYCYVVEQTETVQRRVH